MNKLFFEYAEAISEFAKDVQTMEKPWENWEWTFPTSITWHEMSITAFIPGNRYRRKINSND